MIDAIWQPRGSVRFVGLAGLVLLLVLLLAWGVGLAWYIQLVNFPPTSVPVADGIVALTGGAERIETALQLLVRGQAPRLLLSGVGGGAELPDLDDRARVDARQLAAQITLGRGAQSTRGNAVETAAWAKREGVRSLIVVTAAYHMPRALLELRRALPDVRLYPVPVRPPGFTGWRRLELMALEFTKFLGAQAGLSALVPERRATDRTVPARGPPARNSPTPAAPAPGSSALEWRNTRLGLASAL